MSQENVGVVKASFEAWNAEDMDALRELYHPEAIARPPEGWPPWARPSGGACP